MKPFTITVRVYYEDTDAGRIVYHANYLKFCERARTDWLRTTGISQEKLLEIQEGFVVTSLSCRFKKPARLDDLLTVTCCPVKLRPASVTLSQEVAAEDGTVLFTLEAVVAYLSHARGTPLPLPKRFVELVRNELAAVN